MIHNLNYLVNGSSLSLPAYGRVGQGQHSLAAYFAKRNAKNCGGEKRSGENEGGQKFLPPNPLPFCPSERLDFKIRNSDFAQKMFEHQSKNTAREARAKLQKQWVALSAAPQNLSKKSESLFLVRPEGFEPPTLWSEARYSIR